MGINILVCGSQKFEDKQFVFGIMDAMFIQSKASISNVYTSNFAGACQFAKEWVQLKNEEILAIAKQTGHQNPPHIALRDCTFDMHLEKGNVNLYEQLDFPDIVLRNHPYFTQGAELLIKNGIDSVLAFPNPQNELGASTKNIKRFADLAGIGDKFLDCADAIKNLQHKATEEVAVAPKKSGLINQHPGKKF